MSYINRQQDLLYVEQLRVTDIVKQVGTPAYIYSKSTLEERYHAFSDALKGRSHLICYAMKTNSNLAILKLLAQMGAGFDIVSQGELERVLVAGGDPKKVVFSGVAKTRQEIFRALEVGIRCFNVESEAELYRINEIAGEMGLKAPISLRVNPDVDAKTHPYISTGMKENKFGINHSIAREIYRKASQLPHLNVIGMDCHIGSQLISIKPFLDALDRLLILMDELKEDGITLHHLDLGGGLGVHYKDEAEPEPKAYISALLDKIDAHGGYSNIELMFEPGRALVANAGILVTEVQYIKHHEQMHFAIVDAGMNDLIRPALYTAWMRIEEVDQSHQHPICTYDVVGPICESSDFLGKQRQLAIESGDLLAVFGAGAYGFTMSSNYNSKPKAVEVMVDGDKSYIIRQRETFEQLWQGEQLLP